MTRLRDIHLELQDMPLWMRQTRQNIDWGVLAVMAFCLIIAWSFLLQPGLPQTNASENYVYMTANYAEALREGRLYPRWNSYALLGIGAPTPHYYPPGAPYTSALIEVLFARNSTSAVQIAYVGAIILAGVMMYAFVLRYRSAPAAVLSAVLYIYSPFVGLTTPHLLGDLPLMIVLALTPALLWSIDHLIRDTNRLSIALTALITTGLIITDPLSGSLSIGLGFTYGIYASIRHRTTLNRVVLFAVSLLLGVAIASFYWLPAYLENDLVHWTDSQLTRQPYVLSFSQLIQPAQRIDLSELIPRPQFTLGVSSIIGIVGAISGGIYAARRHKINITFEIFFLVIGGIITIVTVTLIPEHTWILSIITLCVTIAASGTEHLRLLLPEKAQRAFLPGFIAITVVLALPVWLSSQWTSSLESTDALAQIIYEQNGFGVAALPPHSPVPNPLPEPLPINRALVSGYQTGELDRISRSQISLGRELDLIQSSTHLDRYQICVNQSATFSVDRAYFAGWQVNIMDAPAQAEDTCADFPEDSIVTPRTYPDPQTGLLQIEIPGAELLRIMTISLESTPIRRNAWIMSWFALLIVLVITTYQLRREEKTTADRNLLDVTESRLIAVIVITLSASIVLFATPDSLFSLHARPGHSLDGSIAVPDHRTNEGLQLISYRINDTTFSIDDILELDLAWRDNSARQLHNLQVQISIRDPDQNIRWQTTTFRHPGSYPTRRWIPGTFVRDYYRIPIADSLVPGDYIIGIEISLCQTTCEDGTRLTFSGSERQVIGNTLFLPTTLNIR